MQALFIEYLYLILIILGLVIVADKIRIAYPIVLVLGGLGLSFTSIFNHVKIDPELVFLIFLPPLLYEAAWQTSWKEFWRWRRVITSFAFPVVIITACVVALVSNVLIPGFTLALGFLLGGIVSPPDAISATTIMRRVNVPKSLVSIIEGESLLNDASSLIIFRFALATVLTGRFFFQEAATSFALVIVMGALMGLIVALFFYAIHRWLPTTTGIEIVLTLVAPYSMYYAAEHFHFSGVLAVVSGGLFLSSQRQRILNYQSRIQGVNVWESLVFVMNGLVFLLIGLQLPSITLQLGEISLGTAIGYGLAISLVLIITRLLCSFGAVVFTRIMGKFITVADPNPGWKLPLITGWAGMRGVVSLAAALSVPLLMQSGHPFPFRNLILFMTFIVILVTLVLQGITLPWLIEKLNAEDKYTFMPEVKQELVIRRKIAQYTLGFLQEEHGEEIAQNEYLQKQLISLNTDLRFLKSCEEDADMESKVFLRYQAIQLEVLGKQRQWLAQFNSRAEFDEDVIRKQQALIDYEEFKLRES
jgi:monovalent cation/hydrogen antiporter